MVDLLMWTMYSDENFLARHSKPTFVALGFYNYVDDNVTDYHATKGLSIF